MHKRKLSCKVPQLLFVSNFEKQYLNKFVISRPYIFSQSLVSPEFYSYTHNCSKPSTSLLSTILLEYYKVFQVSARFQLIHKHAMLMYYGDTHIK